ncbi:MAG: WS/DGAT domain-containing protein [Acidimicrobiales bacterium]
MSVRGADEHGQFDNRVSGMIADLPVDVADPVERLATVHEHMAELKASGEAELEDAVIAGLATMAPPALLAVGSRVAIKLLERHPGAAIKTVTTNVPGPQLRAVRAGSTAAGVLPLCADRARVAHRHRHLVLRRPRRLRHHRRRQGGARCRHHRRWHRDLDRRAR